MPIFYNGQFYDEAGNPLGLRANPTFVGTTLSASGLVLAGVAGRKIRARKVYLNALASTNVKFQSNSSDISATFFLASNGGAVLPESDSGWFETGVGEALNLTMTISTSVGVQIDYVLV